MKDSANNSPFDFGPRDTASQNPPLTGELRFECTRCGDCCRQEAGDLFLTATDLRRMAEHFDLSDEAFFLEYCEVVELDLAVRVSLVADEDGACVFLGEKGCEIYEHRPLQCQTFPFWASNLTDADAWRQASHGCPGIHQGRIWTTEEVSQLVERREREPMLDVSDEE